MKIAILMSTYNGQEYLNEQLKSIANQTVVEQISLYIRDDGSTDDTVEIIERWKSKINIIFLQGKNVGPAMSFWELLMNPEIHADYYALCDQDDIWDCNKLEYAINALREQKNISLWCSNCRIIDSKGNTIRKKMNDQIPEFSINSQIVCGTTQGCAMVFDDKLREYIKEKRISGYPMHDFVIMTYAIAFGGVIYEDTPLFGYRVHENNVIAKEGKGIIKKFIGSFNRWFSKENKNELSKYLEIFCENNRKYLDESMLKFLEDICDSTSSIYKRFKVISDPKCKSFNKKSERTFKIRVLLGVI